MMASNLWSSFVSLLSAGALVYYCHASRLFLNYNLLILSSHSMTLNLQILDHGDREVT